MTAIGEVAHDFKRGSANNMRWILWIVGSVAVFVAVVWVVGMLLPQNHTATRTLRLKQAPDVVWKAITDFPAMTQWRIGLTKVERMPDRDGHEVWQETAGGYVIPLETIEMTAPRRLVRKVGPGLAFGGKWTYEVAPDGDGSTLTITEDGEVYNPIFRVVGKFMDQSAEINKFQTALAKKFS